MAFFTFWKSNIIFSSAELEPRYGRAIWSVVVDVPTFKTPRRMAADRLVSMLFCIITAGRRTGLHALLSAIEEDGQTPVFSRDSRANPEADARPGF